MKKHVFFITLLLIFFLAGLFTTNLGAADVKRMSAQDLNAVRENPDVIVVDVRANRDWEKSDSKIAGAVRENPEDVNAWMKRYHINQTLVFY